MKKIILIPIFLISLSFGGKCQTMTVNGYDAGTPAPTTNDYWLITWVVDQWNTGHTAIINTWQASDLTLSSKILYYPQSNPWSTSCNFQIVGGPPTILTYDFQVTVGVKRWVNSNNDYGPSRETKSAFMNTNGLTGSFTVSCYIQ
jgi:hypothetical protein